MFVLLIIYQSKKNTPRGTYKKKDMIGQMMLKKNTLKLHVEVYPGKQQGKKPHYKEI
jgi:hypothetical protein